jgi:Calcineurin-like phosphoesterase
MNFDLISDLHLDQWPEDKKLDFKGMGTSLTCIVAGDVSRKLPTTRDFLYQLADNYNQVMFVDGNHEHKNDYANILGTYEWLERELNKKSNITYLRDATCVIDKTAIIGANGWWTFDYGDPLISRLNQITTFCEMEQLHPSTAVKIWDEAIENSEFLADVVQNFNKSNMVDEIIVVTHTVPKRELINPTPYMSLYDLTKLYNSSLTDILSEDVNNKISTWCFGHYHTEACDTIIDNVRYISNPRGRPDDTLFPIYYPKLVTTL